MKVIYANLIFVSVLAGCGGGSSSSSSGSLSVTGVAAKGPLSNATVQAYEVINNNLVAIGSPTTTDTDGGYTLTGLSSTTNPVVVKVTVTSSTTMRDETGTPDSDGRFPLATNAPAAGTELRTALTSLTANNEVHITPYTEMAVSSAISTGTLSSSTIATGQDQIEQLIGINPFNTKPITNANDTSTTSQKNMMVYLASLQKQAKTTSCNGDPSGIKCMISTMNNKMKGTLDSSGNFVPSDPSGLKSSIESGFTGLSFPSGSPMANLNLTNLKNSIASPTTSNASNSLQKASLDSFINVMRTGFNAAQSLIESKVSSAKSRIDSLSKNIVNDSLSAAGKVLNKCKVQSEKLTCTGTEFTVASTGYTFNFTEGDYKYEGTASGAVNSTSGSIIVTAIKKDTNNIKLADFSFNADGSGWGTNSATSGTFNLNALKYIAYSVSDNTKYATANLSGLTASYTSSDNKFVLSAPIVISDSDGDSFSGTLSATGYKFTNYDVVTAVELNLAVKAANSSILGLKITGSQSKDFNQKQGDSITNPQKATATLVFTLSDNIVINASTDETVWGKATVETKITSNSNWIKVSSTVDRDSSGKYINPQTLTITSSGVYKATVTKTNGKYVGDLLNGTTKIGEINDNIITVNGRIVSFN